MSENGTSPQEFKQKLDGSMPYNTGAEPQIIEGPGRYRVFANPDGSWVIARAGPLCERCESCGCGEQWDPVVIPAMFIAMAQSQGGMSRIKAAMKAVRRG